jgi:hypothetical protein
MVSLRLALFKDAQVKEVFSTHMQKCQNALNDGLMWEEEKKYV